MTITTANASPSYEAQFDWEYVGDVAVDSAQLLLIDPYYDRPTAEALDLALRASDLPCAEVALSEHQLHTAFVCCSGMGDGIYPVFVKLTDEGQVAEMRVVFIEGEVE